jgi:hypothetical protein
VTRLLLGHPVAFAVAGKLILNKPPTTGRRERRDRELRRFLDVARCRATVERDHFFARSLTGLEPVERGARQSSQSRTRSRVRTISHNREKTRSATAGA